MAHLLPARLPWLLGFLERHGAQVQVRVLQGLVPKSDWLGRQSLRHLVQLRSFRRALALLFLWAFPIYCLPTLIDQIRKPIHAIFIFQ